jgi:DNA-binding transcriptional MerR regulator
MARRCFRTNPLDHRRLLRIGSRAATGLTPRSIRYYEEIGLLRPAARSQGAFRLYDASDLERLGFIRELRDDAGFSLGEIALLLEDEEARIRDRERFRTTGEAAERRAILRDLIVRMDRQVATLEAKAGRLRAMLEAARRAEPTSAPTWTSWKAASRRTARARPPTSPAPPTPRRARDRPRPGQRWRPAVASPSQLPSLLRRPGDLARRLVDAVGAQAWLVSP